MTIKANGRSALILAAGLLVGFAGSSLAAPDDTDNSAASAKSENAVGAPIALNKFTKHSSHQGKSYAHNKSGKTAQKPAADQKADDAAASADSDNSSASAAMPPSVANANASLASADTATASNAKAMSARANDIVQGAPDNGRPAAETQIVAADQLNDVDRALQAPAPATASAEPPAAAQPPAAPPAAPVMASSSESSTWDQTSLIGKIFIGFGALLTMASAARMFMA